MRVFILILYRYIFGYVKFSARNGFFPRFINLCAGANILLWKTSSKDNCLYGYMLARDYKKCRPFARNAGVRLKVLKRYGLSFIIHRYRKRSGILAGAVLFFGILYFFSLFIWNVNVIGNTKVSSSIIMKNLSALGLQEGALRSKINAEETRQKLLLMMPELSWAAINVDGSSLCVDVRETVKPPESIKSDVPCNIKAAIDGRILDMKITAGIAMLKVGEAVVKGDLLVSGMIEHKNGMTILKHASARVLAETHREITVFIPFKQIVERRTGRSDSRSVVTILGVKIPLYLGSVKGVNERKQKTWHLTISDVKLPFSIITSTFYEIGKIEFKLDEKGAKAKATNEMQSIEKIKLKNIKIVKKESAFTKNNDGITLTVKYLCNEYIEKEENILINQ